jgi:hypothetical protein
MERKTMSMRTREEFQRKLKQYSANIRFSIHLLGLSTKAATEAFKDCIAAMGKLPDIKEKV